MLVFVAGKNAAVKAKDVAAGNDVHAVNVGRAFGRLKCASCRLEQFVFGAKFFVEALVKREAQAVCGKACVEAFVRPRAVALLSANGELKPQNIFFGNLYRSPLRVAAVGD